MSFNNELVNSRVVLLFAVLTIKYTHSCWDGLSYCAGGM